MRSMLAHPGRFARGRAEGGREIGLVLGSMPPHPGRFARGRAEGGREMGLVLRSMLAHPDRIVLNRVHSSRPDGFAVVTPPRPLSLSLAHSRSPARALVSLFVRFFSKWRASKAAACSPSRRRLRARRTRSSGTGGRCRRCRTRASRTAGSCSRTAASPGRTPTRSTTSATYVGSDEDKGKGLKTRARGGLLRTRAKGGVLNTGLRQEQGA